VCVVDLQSVTSIWTQSQHEQQTSNALSHLQASDDLSSQKQPSAPSSADGRHSRRKLRNIRQLLTNRVAPLNVCSDTETSSTPTVADRLQLALPVYSQFITSSLHTQADTALEGSGSCSVVCAEPNTNQVNSSTQMTNAIPDTGVDDDDDSTVAADSDYCMDGLSNNSAASCVAETTDSNDPDDDAISEKDVHSNSNYSIASSDTAALSIKLDENYDPVPEPVAETKPQPSTGGSTTKAVVQPVISRRSNIPILRVSASLPTTAATSKSNSATQTSIAHPLLGYYQQPFPYPVFGYGGYVPPMPPLCETPIWPPYPPPLPWYYANPHYDPMMYMPAAPPYCVLPPPATNTSNSNQSSLPQQTDTTRGLGLDQSAVSVEPSRPAVVPPASFNEPAVSTADKMFRPIASQSCFQPTAGSLFKPVPSSGCRSEPPANDTRLSHSLLEMVELATPQLDSATDDASDNSDAAEDNDDAEDEAEREAWEAEQERQRIRRRHTRQWMRALQTDIDHQQQLSD